MKSGKRRWLALVCAVLLIFSLMSSALAMDVEIPSAWGAHDKWYFCNYSDFTLKKDGVYVNKDLLQAKVQDDVTAVGVPASGSVTLNVAADPASVNLGIPCGGTCGGGCNDACAGEYMYCSCGGKWNNPTPTIPYIQIADPNSYQGYNAGVATAKINQDGKLEINGVAAGTSVIGIQAVVYRAAGSASEYAMYRFSEVQTIKVTVVADHEAPPQAPENLRAAPGDTNVKLSWDAAGSATSYNIYQKSGDTYTKVASNLVTNKYTVTGLNNGTEYTFAVTAVNVGGESAKSADAGAAPAVHFPSAPTVFVTKNNGLLYTLNWTASDADSYTVYLKKDGDADYTAIARGTNITRDFFKLYVYNTVYNSYTYDMEPGTTYDVVVTATNESGTSGYSQSITVTPDPQPLPAPSALKATSLGSSVFLSWTGVTSTGADHSFNIYMASGGGAYQLIGNTAGLNYTTENLDPGTHYFKVTAVTPGVGESESAATASATACSGSGWGTVGAKGFTTGVTSTPAYYTDGGTPYVAYQDSGHDKKLTVMKYTGDTAENPSGYSLLGTAGFTAGRAFNPSLFVDNGTPYVAFRDGGNSNKLSVMKYTGITESNPTGWEPVGTGGISLGLVNKPSIYVYNGTPYVAATDAGNKTSNSVTVWKYVGISNENPTGWATVGGAGFMPAVNSISLELDAAGMPYVAYQEGGTTATSATAQKATVLKYTGNGQTGWETVGKVGFSPSTVSNLSFDIDGSGTPYIAFSDETPYEDTLKSSGMFVYDKATVMKYTGSGETGWETVGDPGFSFGKVSNTSISLYQGVPYVAFQDARCNNAARVMRYNGSAWETVGGTAISDGAVQSPFLSVSTQGIYASYLDKANNNQLTVMRYAFDNTPTGLNAVSGNGQANLTWNALTGATGYNVYCKTASDADYKLLTSSPITDLSYTAKNLSNGTAYTFAVTAIVGGAESDKATATTTPTDTVTAPQMTGFTVSTDHSGTALSNLTDDIYINLKVNFNQKITIIDAKKAVDELSISLNNGDIDFTSTPTYLSSSSLAYPTYAELKLGSDRMSLEFKLHVGYAPYAGHLVIKPDNKITQITSEDGSAPAEWSTIDLYVPNGVTLTTASQTMGSSDTATPASVTKTVNAPVSATRAMVHMLFLKNGVPVGNLDDYGVNLETHYHNYLALDAAQFAKLVAGYFNSTFGTDYTATADGANVTIKAKNVTNGDVLDLRIFAYPQDRDTKANKTDLNAAIADVESRISKLDGEDYTEDSWQALVKEIAVAKSISKNVYYLQSEVDAEVTALNNALGGLKREPQGDLPTPKHLAAIAGDAQVTLSWNACTGATGYKVYKGTASGSYGSDPAATVTNNTCTVTGLSNNTAYYFKVVATDNNGKTSYASKEVSATPAYVFPPAEVHLSLKNHTASLSWSAVSNATGYAVFMRVAGESYGKAAATVDSSILSYQASGLTEDKDYYFYVAALRDGKSSAKSTEVSATCLPQHTITFITNGGSTVSSVKQDVGTAITSSPSTTRRGYTFGGWYTDSALKNKVGFPYTVTGDVTFYAKWTANSSGGTSGGSGGGSSGGTSGGTTPSGTNDTGSATFTSGNTTTATTTITATTKNGAATAAITSKQMTGAIADAVKAAEKNKTDAAVEIKVDAAKGITSVQTSIPKGTVSTMADKNVSALTVTSPIASVCFDSKALASISSGADMQLSVSAVDASTLPAGVQQKLGGHPVYNLSLSAGGSAITSFGNGRVSIAIPYTLGKNEDANGVVIYYIGSDGTLNKVTNSVYDPETHLVRFVTDHFSNYSVGYAGVSFTDVSGWYADDVHYLAARDVMNGTAKGIFSPGKTITRAEAVQLLANLADADLSKYAKSSFTDVSVNDWYCAAVQWANEKGVVKGYNGAFDPNANVTRQDLAVMLQRYVENVAGYKLKETTKAVNFSDKANIAAYAQNAVKALQTAGIIAGKGNNVFDPNGNATRAEAAKMVAVLLQSNIHLPSMCE